MIEQCVIFSKSGLVLWSHGGEQVSGNPVKELISTVLLEERAGESTFSTGEYQLRWTLDNDLELVFVAVYFKVLQLTHVDDLLAELKARFVTMFRKTLPTLVGKVEGFDSVYHDVSLLTEGTVKKVVKKPRDFRRTKKGKEVSAMASDKSKSKKKKGKKGRGAGSDADETGSATETGDDTDGTDGTDDGEGAVDGVLTGEARRKVLEARMNRRKKAGSGAKSPGKASRAGTKKPREWDAPRTKVTKQDMDALDRSGQSAGDALAAQAGSAFTEGDSLVDRSEEGPWEETLRSRSADSDAPASTGWGLGSLGKWFRDLTSEKVLEADDLAGALDAMRSRLLEKNVATEVADELCESVQNKLVGRRVPSARHVEAAVREAFEEALTRILTPKKSTDVLRAALQAKADGRPFVIVFIGVNGVGKSTSLSKICYYLRQKNLSVLIAACDTFRSGAVEQLRTHANRLGVDVYAQGYSKDPSAVAGQAIKSAVASGTNCVLIDTAGRMQNNTALMRELAKLVANNKPDLVLFVGEALVGNDGVDQLVEFNGALERESTRLQFQRRIDGIVLTKFDTIDDKVGAAVSMSYKTSQPIMFVGTGQKYTHLRRLNVKTVIESLLA